MHEINPTSSRRPTDLWASGVSAQLLNMSPCVRSQSGKHAGGEPLWHGHKTAQISHCGRCQRCDQAKSPGETQVVAPGLVHISLNTSGTAVALPAAARWEARGDGSARWRIHRSLGRLEKWAGKKRDSMKLNRKLSTVTRRRTSCTDAGQGPAAPEKRGGSQAKFRLIASCYCRQSHL